jgi:hypothetical protein
MILPARFEHYAQQDCNANTSLPIRYLQRILLLFLLEGVILKCCRYSRFYIIKLNER